MNFYYLGLEEGGGRQKDFQTSILFLYLKTKAKWIKKHARISILVYVIHIKTKSYADGFCLWENSHKHVILHNGRINYLEPMAHAWPGVILLPPRWDLSPLQRYPPSPPPPSNIACGFSYNSPVPTYTPGWREALWVRGPNTITSLVIEPDLSVRLGF